MKASWNDLQRKELDLKEVDHGVNENIGFMQQRKSLIEVEAECWERLERRQ